MRKPYSDVVFARNTHVMCNEDNKKASTKGRSTSVSFHSQCAFSASGHGFFFFWLEDETYGRLIRNNMVASDILIS